MNFEGVGSFFPNFLRVGANWAESVASPTIATEEAASGHSYGLGLRGSHNACRGYYLILMYSAQRDPLFFT